MGWFDEQIRQRKLSDQEIMEDSLFRMASVVLGRQRAGALSDERIVTKAAIDDILKFYHYKPVEIPDNVKGLDEQLEFCLRPHGLMYRSVKLEEGWYKDAFGPMLAYRKEDGMAVALLPKPFIGYWFRDPVTGKKTDLNRKTAEIFESDAICFYRPLPLKKLGIADLIKYLAECLSAGDIVSIVVLTFVATLVGMLMTNANKALTGFVLQSKNLSLLLGTAAFTLSVIISTQLLDGVRALMMNRLEIKTSLSVEAAMMMRVMNLPANFFRKYASGELSSRYDAVNQLSSLLLGNIFSTGLGAIFSLMYI
ncbi:MAG: NHLP family bacteriocin export ABC transporter permease/ATPase subunit, partial [Eubacteriales bacterium]|nr:NHLP family bacteriocin export ABC transporter permease/ATPase subunit [Eubacteriales bacterium]